MHRCLFPRVVLCWFHRELAGFIHRLVKTFKNEVYLFPKKACDIHFLALDEVLTVLVREYADFSGVKVESPSRVNTDVIVLSGLVESVVAGSPTLEESYLGNNEGRRLKNRPIEEGGDSDPWQPKENATQLPRKEVFSNQRGYCTQGRRPKDPSVRRGGDPRTLASLRHWLLQVVAATAGMRAGSSARRVDGQRLRACRAPQLTSYMAPGSRFMSDQCVQRDANQMLASGLKLVSD